MSTSRRLIGGAEFIPPFILKISFKWKWVVNLRPKPSPSPEKKPSIASEREARWAPEPLRKVLEKKNSQFILLFLLSLLAFKNCRAVLNSAQRFWFSVVLLIEALRPKRECFSVSFKNLNIYGAPFRYFYFESKTTFSILCALCHKSVVKYWNCFNSKCTFCLHRYSTCQWQAPVKKVFRLQHRVYINSEPITPLHQINNTSSNEQLFWFLWWPVDALFPLPHMVLKPLRLVLCTIVTSSFLCFSSIFFHRWCRPEKNKLKLQNTIFHLFYDAVLNSCCK